MNDESAVQRPEDVGTRPEAVVRRWLMELEAEGRAFDKWRKQGKKVVDTYRDDKRTKGSQLNILWSNTEVLKPALFSNTPEPDVRRRFRDKDPVGRYAAQVLERALSFTIDSECLDETMEAGIEDYLLPGRGIIRCDYEPTLAEMESKPGADEDGPEEELVAERLEWEHWDWRKFRHDPADKWEDVRWISYEHEMTREELEDLAGPEKAGKVQMGKAPDNMNSEDRELHAKFLATACVYEIWDKTERQVVYISPGYADGPLLVKPDPLNLTGFFNTPKPLYSVKTNGSLVPIPEYTQYQDQADELNNVTGRIDRLIAALKVRGVYDASMEAVDRLMRGDDNELIPEENWPRMADKGGIEGIISWMPVEQIAKVLIGLYQQRDQLMGLIYQITGISDVMRGDSDPNETASAQRLKGQFGNFRMKPRQRAVQRYVRDLMRIAGEIIAEKFSVETLMEMTNLDLPTAQQKSQGEILVGLLAQQQKPVPEPLDAMMKKPSWQEVKQLLSSDLLRGFRVDIETDSTIAPDDVAEKQSVTEFLTAIGGFFNQVAPLVQQGMVPADTAIHMLNWAARKFKVSREIEDKLAELAEKLEQSQPQQQNDGSQVEMKKIETEAQTDLKTAEMKAQSDAQVALQVEEMKSRKDIIIAQIQAGAKLDQAQIDAALKMAGMEMEHARTRDADAMEDARERESMQLTDQRERERPAA